MKKIEVRYLSSEEVLQSGLTMKTTIDVTEKVYRAHSEGKATLGKKTGINMEPFGRRRDSGLTAMTAFLQAFNVAGLKWIGLNFDNPAKHDLPSHTALIVLNDAETMVPLAIMEGGWITAMRTGAATAVGAKYLARKDSRVVGILGAGFQSRFQIRALNEVLQIDKILITDLVKARCEELARETKAELGLNVITADSPKAIAEKSDVIVTLTSADAPLIRHQWLRPGTLLCALTDHSNFDFEVTKNANKIIVDDTYSTMHLGELSKWVDQGLISEKNIYAEIGEVILGQKKGREKKDEQILYVPIGMGSLDVATANEVFTLSKKKNLGKLLAFI
ncbi:MAG: ornithine cyclodeaminase family protein [Promethearchaeota archaeon]